MLCVGFGIVVWGDEMCGFGMCYCECDFVVVLLCVFE